MCADVAVLHGTPFTYSNECMTDHFVKIAGSETVTLRTILDGFVANDNIWAFKRRLDFWEICTAIMSLAASPYIKDFSDETVGEMVFWYFIMKCINI